MLDTDAKISAEVLHTLLNRGAYLKQECLGTQGRLKKSQTDVVLKYIESLEFFCTASVTQVQTLVTELKNKNGVKRLPDERQAITHKFVVAEQRGYMTVGMYDDGSPGELFLRMEKEGTTIRGLLDVIGIMTSAALQRGVPIEDLVDKFSFQRFEPSGITNNPDIQFAYSVIDYVFRWLGRRFLENTTG